MAESDTPIPDHAPATDIKVEVAYALPERQLIVALEAAPGITADQAIARSGIAAQFLELEQGGFKFGLFGKVCKPDQVLREGDRVEIYRPLIADPKQVRRERAAKGKSTRKGAKAINS